MQVNLSTDQNTANWGLSSSVDGGVVVDNNDLAQQALTVLTTNKGSVPFDPELGWNIQLYVDAPVTTVIPNGKVGILDALEYGVPLITVERVEHEFSVSDPSTVVFIVYCSSNLGTFAVAVSNTPNFTPQVVQGPFSGGFSSGFQFP